MFLFKQPPSHMFTNVHNLDIPDIHVIEYQPQNFWRQKTVKFLGNSRQNLLSLLVFNTCQKLTPYTICIPTIIRLYMRHMPTAYEQYELHQIYHNYAYHTSDMLVKKLSVMASGAIHLDGNISQLGNSRQVLFSDMSFSRLNPPILMRYDED